MLDNHHICVCICTYKRPDQLNYLLSKLESQEVSEFFTYSIVVVDNDKKESARNCVESYASKSNIEISYYVEPEQNISLARNKAIQCSRGDFLAFIDDDEFPIKDWLVNLYNACSVYLADGALGPVIPSYDANCPSWLIKSKLCERKSHKTGTMMLATSSRTGNLLLKRGVFANNANMFDPQFGRTGGEDIRFFLNAIEIGHIFIWCEEAPVYEVVSTERWKASYYLKRSIRIGGLSGIRCRNDDVNYKYLCRNVLALFIHCIILPFTILLGKHVFIRVLDKSAYNAAFTLAFYGYSFFSMRDEQQ